jgi:hypothetical protein
MSQTEKKSGIVMETSMIRDFARRVIDDFGDQTDSYVASRIGVLIRDGDSYGVGLWKAVASEIERIRLPAEKRPRSRH